MCEKLDDCPTCGECDQWVYDLQKCGNCGYGHFKSGVALIGAERLRHTTEEGWTPEHDDNCHDDGALSLAAAYYAAPVEIRCEFQKPCNCREAGCEHFYGLGWEWREAWPFDEPPKPKDRISDLVRAGALIAAEIDRLQRREFRA
jgi:hypothetical protein